MKKNYTEELKNQIIQRWQEKESISSISEKTNISRSTIYRWINDYQRKNNFCELFVNKIIKEQSKKIEKLECLINIINDVGVSPSAPLKEKLVAMAPFYKKYNVYWLCEAMNVPRGTFYNHIFRGKHNNTWYSKQREIIREAIQRIYDEHRQIYGATKITAILKEQGYRTSEKTVSMLMHDMGLKSIRHRAKAIYENDIKVIKQNKLKQQFQVERPNEVWVSDVTCFKTLKKTFYICVILDLFSRKVIAYRVSRNNCTYLIKETLKAAYELRDPKDNLIFHSDQGSNYQSKTFASYIKSLKIIDHSFSRSATPYDNAVIESFFSSLKREELYRTRYKTEKEFREALDNYIIFYNSKRPHSNNNYKTPDAKELQYFSQNK